MWNDALYGDAWNEPAYSDGGRYVSSFNFSYERRSYFSSQPIFDLDTVNFTMRENDPFTKKEAALAAMRLHDSILSNLETERMPNSEDMAILDETNARMEAIFNSESDWTKGSGGKVHYVSPNGNDNNSGLSPRRGVLYKSWDIGQLVNYSYQASEAAAASFSGNTYLQDNYGVLVNAAKIDGEAAYPNDIVLNNIVAYEKLAEALSDTAAVIPAVSTKTETVTDPDEPDTPVVPDVPDVPDTPDVPSDNPFVDVEQGKFYYDPVLWAVENGITTGMDATHFAPGNTCTRGQVVTFLYRYCV